MPRITLTDDNIHTLECPGDKRFEIWRDEVIPGLELHITRATGTRTFVAMHRTLSGSKRPTRLGTVNEMTLPAARRAASSALDKADKEDQKARKERGRETLQAAFESYIRAKNIAPENATRYRHVLEVYGGPLWTCELSAITPKAVLDQRDAVADGSFVRWHQRQGRTLKAQGGPGQANYLIQYGSMVLAYRLGRHAVNPFAGIEPKPTASSDTERYVFEPKDLPAVWEFIARQDAASRTLFWVAFLVGARPTAIARLMWKRLDLQAGTYELTQDKTECQGWKPATSPAWKYPLDAYTLELLRDYKAWNARDDDEFVFQSRQGRRSGQPISDTPLSNIYLALRAALGLPASATPYAARYTRATYSETLFGDTLLTQRMLNHQSDWGEGRTVRGRRMGATPRYVVSATELVRPYVQTYADTILELAGQKPMSPRTRAVFIDRSELTIWDRHQLVLQSATPEVLYPQERNPQGNS
jgi:integrase